MKKIFSFLALAFALAIFSEGSPLFAKEKSKERGVVKHNDHPASDKNYIDTDGLTPENSVLAYMHIVPY